MAKGDYVAVRDLPRATVRASEEFFEKVERYRQKIGARSTSDAIVHAVEKALAKA